MMVQRVWPQRPTQPPSPPAFEVDFDEGTRSAFQRMAATLTQILEETRKVPDRVTAPPRSAEDAEFFVRTVTVSSAGTPVQGPDVTIPDGYTVSVTMRRPTSSPSRVGYVAGTKQETGTTGTRKEVYSESSINGLALTNMKYLWFDSDTNGTVFEIMANR